MALSGNSYNNRRGRKRTQQNPFGFNMVFGGVFVVAFVAFIGAFLHMSSKPSDAKTSGEVDVVPADSGEILVPVETIQVGALLQPTMFRKELKSEDQITGDMVRSYDDLKGMYAKGVLVRNLPILKGALTNRQPVHILTAMLPKSYRAVALEVEKPLLDNVDGWAQPGTDVDVVWITSAFGKEMAAVLAGPVRVLASNKSTEYSQAKKTDAETTKLVTVTLLLSTRDAVRISLASMHGKISLSLRGASDKKPNEAAKPISSVTDEGPAPNVPRPMISVKVIDPQSKAGEIRQYDQEGRRLSGDKPS